MLNTIEFSNFIYKRTQEFYDVINVEISKRISLRSPIRNLRRSLKLLDSILEQSTYKKTIFKKAERKTAVINKKIVLGNISIVNKLNILKNKVEGIIDTYRNDTLNHKQYNKYITEVKEECSSFIKALESYREDNLITHPTKVFTIREENPIIDNKIIELQDYLKENKNKLTFAEFKVYQAELNKTLEAKIVEENNSRTYLSEPSLVKEETLSKRTQNILRNLADKLHYYDKKYLDLIQQPIQNYRRLKLPILCYTTPAILSSTAIKSTSFKVVDLSPGYIMERQVVIVMTTEMFYSINRKNIIEQELEELNKKAEYVDTLNGVCFTFNRTPKLIYIWLMKKQDLLLLNRPMFVKVSLAFSHEQKNYIDKEERIRQQKIKFEDIVNNKTRRLNFKLNNYNNKLVLVNKELDITLENIIKFKKNLEILENKDSSIIHYNQALMLKHDIACKHSVIAKLRGAVKLLLRRKSIYENIIKNYTKVINLQKDKIRVKILRSK